MKSEKDKKTVKKGAFFKETKKNFNFAKKFLSKVLKLCEKFGRIE